MYVCMHYPTTLHEQGATQGNFLSEVEQVWIPKFPSSWLFATRRLKSPVYSITLPIAKGRIIGFIPFSSVLALCEMQTFSFRIWTRVTVSISYDDIHYQSPNLGLRAQSPLIFYQ